MFTESEVTANCIKNKKVCFLHVLAQNKVLKTSEVWYLFTMKAFEMSK